MSSDSRRWFSGLARSLALVFALLGVTLALLIAVEWLWILEPRLAADAESRSRALAQAQANTLAKILSRDPGHDIRADLESAMDSILLIKDSSTDTPFVRRIGLTVDYDLLAVPPMSLDIARGVGDCGACFITDIPIYHQDTGALIASARIHSSPRFVQEFDAEVVESVDHRVRIRFRVSDSGIGLSADQLPALFTHFTQSDGGVSRRYGGTGLGLAICHRLVELMGGEIGARGEPGKGSTFWVELPLRMARPRNGKDPGSQPKEMAARPLRLLVVDDEPLNRLFLRTLLTKYGHRVELAKNGLEALRAAGAEQFDLVFMDLWMPEMNGFEAARRIRMLPEPAIARVPIVALTADVTDEAADEAQRSGINEIVVKPVSPDKLSELLRTYRT